MAGGGDIRVKVGIDGEADFKKQIGECNTSLKTMSTEMAKVTTSFIGNENSSKALRAANKALTEQMDLLNKKADIQKSQLEALDKAGVDPTSASYQKLVQELNKTETEMNKTGAQIDQNNEKLKHHGQTAEEAHKKHAEAAKKAAEAVAGVVASVAAIGVGLAKLALDAGKAADEMNTLSLKTGLSREELQKYQYAADTIDVSVDTIAGSMGKLTKTMSSAATGSGAAAEAFAKLGVAVTKDDGTFRNRNDVFKDAVTALGNIADETERDATAMAIFGKSATELNPLILGGAEALEQLGQHAEDAGLILSGDAMDSLANLSDRFGILKQTIGMAGQQFLAQFAEPLTKAIDTVIGYVERLVKAFQEGGFSQLASTAGQIVTEIAQKFNEALPGIAEFGTKLILTIVEGIVSMLPDIVQSAVTIITSLAQGIGEALPELIPAAVEAVMQIVDVLTNPDSIGALVDAAIEIMLGLANGLINAIPKLLEKAPVIISNLVTALVENVPKLLEAAFEVIAALVSGLIDNLPAIGKAAGEIIGTLLEGLATLWMNLLDAGRNIVEGIWEGIKGAGDWLWNQIKGFFGGLIDGICEFLGIHSPSTVFENLIGKNMALGIGEGFSETMSQVERDMMSAITVPDVGVNGAVGVSGSDTYGASGSGVLEIVVPVTLDGVECGRGLYRYITGEGARIGPAMVT